ncbi:Holliday junction resolvase RuvX [Lacimicrobium alkaliphilum]|uniref:Putative pre-16S rRNA nuclease n=1 Tax=Lacimicrobium alkaliphilum TaxID=1526571 RepID=A0ABQ1QZ55_9ALTE|nr:Holliday junction resolvase RuvX [Lacimicrobium alkaliphilum]GGD49435.1 putative pre-16S rRNA nuclease [Lacimicrobium alkaliphilum]
MSNANNTVLGFDFGTKSIGVATGQQITGTAAPLAALTARDGIPDWDKVDALFQEWQPAAMVVGLPLNMDGSKQHVTFAAQKFANRLHARFRIPVYTCDERLTSADARARLFELGGFKKLDKHKVDSVAACLILESWMNS